MNLSRLRRRIDDLDQEMLSLLNRRAVLVLRVGRLKKKHSVPVFDSKREAALLSRLAGTNHGPLPTRSIRLIFKEILRQSRHLQVGDGKNSHKRFRNK